MRHPLHTVHNWAGKVVGGIHFVLGAGGRVGLRLAAVDGGVPQTAVGRLHVNLGPQTILREVLICTLFAVNHSIEFS